MTETEPAALIAAVVAVVLGGIGLVAGLIGYVQGAAALHRATVARQRATAAEEAATQAREQAERAARAAERTVQAVRSLGAEVPLTGPITFPAAAAAFARSAGESTEGAASVARALAGTEPVGVGHTTEESASGAESPAPAAVPRETPMDVVEVPTEPDAERPGVALEAAPLASAGPEEASIAESAPDGSVPTQSAAAQFFPAESASEQPATEQPATGQPATEQSATEQSGTEQPATEQPAPGEAAGDASAADGSADEPLGDDPPAADQAAATVAPAAPEPPPADAVVGGVPPADATEAVVAPPAADLPADDPPAADSPADDASTPGGPDAEDPAVDAGGRTDTTPRRTPATEAATMDWSEALRTGAIPLPTVSRGTYAPPPAARATNPPPATEAEYAPGGMPFDLRHTGRQRYELVNNGDVAVEGVAVAGAGEHAHLLRPGSLDPVVLEPGGALPFSILHIEGREPAVLVAWLVDGERVEQTRSLP